MKIRKKRFLLKMNARSFAQEQRNKGFKAVVRPLKNWEKRSKLEMYEVEVKKNEKVC